MAETVNVHAAKTHLSSLLQRVREGAVITIGKAGEPIARLVPIEEATGAPAQAKARRRARQR